MNRNGRRVYGVITANAADIEQREILSGIISRAQSLEIDIAVISNIYNPTETTEALKTENCIYDLLQYDAFDGFILISESILNPDVQQRILKHLQNRSSVPVLVIGVPLPGFVLPHFRFINTSDEKDLEKITEHLIQQHGFTEIHILTGHDYINASHKRVDGYRNALETHGIPVQEKNIFYGDFWLTSGKAQAQKYSSGELPFPQALICCNDCMAYGFLDECLEQGIPVPEKIAVIGYEYSHERRVHAPLLTTCQRNRKALGEEAVRMLTEKLQSGEYGSFTPPEGTFIPGETCGCGAELSDIRCEIRAAQTRAVYDFLNLFSQLEHRLTECRSIEEFAAQCRNFRFMIRDVQQLYLCLYENWYEPGMPAENMVCYNLLSAEEPLIYRKQEFFCLFRGEAAPYYFCPLFFAQQELGYVVLGFDHPDTFDHIFRNWLKSVSNALEFLRMKNDILYLTECQNLSARRDTLTGMYNEKGIRKAYQTADKNELYAVVLQIGLFGKEHGTLQESAPAILDAAEAIRQFCGNHDVCGKISEKTFFCLVHSSYGTEFLESFLEAVLCQHTVYMQTYGLDSFVCCAVPCTAENYTECQELCRKLLDQKTAQISERRRLPHYSELNQIRSRLYCEPEMTFDSEQIYTLFGGSKGYFRQVFRNCYGFTLHDDCTAARIARAKYCLAVTSLSLAEIARQCGYHDAKYFMRQFQQETGVTAVQYRNMMK